MSGRGPLVLLLALGMATACRGSSLPKVLGTPTPAAPTHTPTDPRAVADTALVHQADLPAGWLPLQHQDDPKDRARSRAYDACLHLPSVHADRLTVAYSDFESPDKTVFVSAENSVLTTTSLAARVVSARGGARGPACLTTSVNRYPPTDAGTTMSFVDARAITLPAGLAGTRVTLRLISPTGSTYIVYDDAISFSVGSVLGTISIAGVGKPPPADLDTSLVTSILSRALAEARE